MNWKKYNTNKKNEIKNEIKKLENALDKLVNEEALNPTFGKSHTFRVATYNRYNNRIEELKNELSKF